MKSNKIVKTFEEHTENLNISNVMNSSFSCDVYATNGGLGHQEYAYLIRLEETKNGYNYLVIDITQGPKKTNDYEIGSIVDVENIYVEKVEDYKLRRSELWGSFLFHFFLKNYCS